MKKKKNKKPKSANKKEQLQEKESEKGKPKKRKEKSMKQLIRKIIIVIVVLAFIVVASAIGLYFYSPLEKYSRPVFKSVPYPVAIVGNARSIVTSRELIRNTDAVRKFYENQDFTSKGLRVDFNTEHGKMRLKVKEKDVFDKLIENRIVEELANEKGIVVSKAEVQQKIDEKISEYGDSKSLELSLGSLYGWSISEFRDNVVIYQIYLKRLFAAYALEVEQQEGFKKAEEAREKIDDKGTNFPEIVKEYSEGESVESEGELGWFRYHQLIPEVADVVFSMEPGEISNTIVSPVGFHIVHLQETREQEVVGENLSNEEDDSIQKIKEVKIRQIYVHGQTFLDWLMEQKKSLPVIILMKDYTWDSNSGFIEFKDPVMKNNESKIRMRSKGDPSIKVIK